MKLVGIVATLLLLSSVALAKKGGEEGEPSAHGERAQDQGRQHRVHLHAQQL